MKVHRFAALLFSFCLVVTPIWAADPPKKEESAKKDVSVKTGESLLPAALLKPLPESLDDLKAIQTQTRKVLEKVIPCTVGVQIGNASGSGVIVSKDGYVLTAGHVSGAPGQSCKFILSDGKIIEGKSLGRDEAIDSGLFKITAKGEWPYVETGKSADLKAGQWCIATGHPNGYQSGRPPVVRLGRILNAGARVIATDCTLVGGDSGGPLFDMEGKVIAIHSRIGMSIKSNMHVPVDQYTSNWDRLTKGEEIKPLKSQTFVARLGVVHDDNAKECRLYSVTEGSPAYIAGLKAGDVITKFDGKELKTYKDFEEVFGKKKPGDEVELIVKRGSEEKSFKVKLDKR